MGLPTKECWSTTFICVVLQDAAVIEDGADYRNLYLLTASL